MSTALAYRRDIDGLRALAILPVVLYHAGFPGFGGGFVGVDLFFVISGYLISTIILREVAAGEFRFSQFWLRRARRILPAMALMVLVTLALGFLFLAPDDLSELGDSVRYQSYFVANHYFYKTTGYFNTAAELKPLLHMWSLAVEEQFYLFFPILFVLLWRVLPRVLIGWVWLLIALASLALSQWWMSHEQSTAAFFLLPARAWELLAGSLLAWWHFRRPNAQPSLPWAQGASLLGLALVVMAVVGYRHDTPFPGVAALPPVVGAVLMIWANRQPTWVRSWFSSRVLVGIGLISYSLYLWHWPLLVYANYRSLETPPLELRGAVVLLSMLLAYLSWRWIEGPFRRRQWLPANRQVWAAAALSIAVVFLLGRAVGKSDGFPERLPEAAQRYTADRERTAQQEQCLQRRFEGAEDLCRIDGDPQAVFTPRLLVWGDSHSEHLLPVLNELAQQYRVDLLLFARPECLPFLPEEAEDQGNCAQFNRLMFELMVDSGVDHVLMAARWAVHLYGEERYTRRVAADGFLLSAPVFARQLSHTEQAIRAQGVSLWLLQQVPLQRHDIPRYLTQRELTGQANGTPAGRPLGEHQARQREVNAAFASLADRIHLLDATPILCADGKLCIAEAQGHALYRDDDHLSVFGSLYIRAALEPLFQALRPDAARMQTTATPIPG